MRDHPPVTDTGLLLGSVFVAVSIVGIGILGQQQGTVQMASSQGLAMTAAASVPSASTAQDKKKCLDEKTQQSGVETPCVDGCHYVVRGGSFPVRANLTATTQYSDGSQNPGTVQYEASGASSFTTLTCKAGASIGSASGGMNGAQTLQSFVGSGSDSLMNVQQPSAQSLSASQGASGVAQGGAATVQGTQQVSNSTSPFTMSNLPTQPGIYPLSGGVPGELVSYTETAGPNLNGSAGQGIYNFWNPANIGGEVPTGSFGATGAGEMPSGSGSALNDFGPMGNTGAGDVAGGNTLPGTVSPATAQANAGALTMSGIPEPPLGSSAYQLQTPADYQNALNPCEGHIGPCASASAPSTYTPNPPGVYGTETGTTGIVPNPGPNTGVKYTNGWTGQCSDAAGYCYGVAGPQLQTNSPAMGLNGSWATPSNATPITILGIP